MHRNKVLKDEDYVPKDTVDLGEEDIVENVTADNDLDLSYLWMVDARKLGPQSAVELPKGNETKTTLPLKKEQNGSANKVQVNKSRRVMTSLPPGIAYPVGRCMRIMNSFQRFTHRVLRKGRRDYVLCLAKITKRGRCWK